MTKLEMWLRDAVSPAMPKLLTAVDASRIVHLTPARLTELAEAQVVPHARIDGGPPLFFQKDLEAFVRSELMKIVPGRALPDALVIYRTPNPAGMTDIPDALLEHRDALKVMIPDPALPCVYFLVSSGAIVYVGSTINLAKRAQEHRDMGKVFDRVFYLLVPRDELLAREYQFIRAIRPPLNGRRASIESILAEPAEAQPESLALSGSESE